MNTKTILIADDDADDRHLIELAVKETGRLYNLLEAEHGEQMMKLLYDMDAPYCIFLDVKMPGKNGLDYLADIRSNPKLKDVPVIIYSAMDNDNTVDTAYTYGANIFLNKTGDYKLLLDKVNKILDQNSGMLKAKFDRSQFEIKS